MRLCGFRYCERSLYFVFGHQHLTHLNVVPIDVCEEGVCLDGIGVGGEPSHSPVDIQLKQTLNEGLGL